MCFYCLASLWDMGATVAGHPRPEDHYSQSDEWLQRRFDYVFLYPAIVKTSVTLSNGAVIRAGTIIITRDDVAWNDHEHLRHDPLNLSLCFSPRRPAGNL